MKIYLDVSQYLFSVHLKAV